MIEKRDFSKRKFFPGATGNAFDKALHLSYKVQALPFILILFFLALFAYLPNIEHPIQAFPLFIFFLGDWALLYFLPKRRISFGPEKPSTLILALMRTVFIFIPQPFNWLLQIIGTGLVIYGFWIEPHNIQVTKQNITSNKLHSETSFTLLHLSDLHLERITKRELQLNQLIRTMKPDLILFSGDFLNLSNIRDKEAIHDANKLIAEWEAPLGIYCVTGSPAVDIPESVSQILSSTKAKLINNQKFELQIGKDQIEVFGLYCSHKPHIDIKTFADLKTTINNQFKILLYHSPDLAPEIADTDVDLMLSGHTHGGQVQLPIYGALITASLYGKQLEAGLYDLKDLKLYISRGIGMEGAGAPRVRFLCSPEIILWKIQGNNELSNIKHPNLN